MKVIIGRKIIRNCAPRDLSPKTNIGHNVLDEIYDLHPEVCLSFLRWSKNIVLK